MYLILLSCRAISSNSGDLLTVYAGTDVWFIDMNDPTQMTKVTSGQFGQVGNGAWDAADEFFYLGALVPTRRNKEDFIIHTIDATGTIRNLGVRGRHVHCRMP